MLINHPTDGATHGLTLRVRLLGQIRYVESEPRGTSPVRNVESLVAVLLTVGRFYVGNDVTHSTLLDRACGVHVFLQKSS